MKFKRSLLTAAVLGAAVIALLPPASRAQTQMQFPTTPWGGFAPGVVQCGVLKGANANTTADQAIAITIPTTNYEIAQVAASSASISLDTAAGGVYTAASKAGTQVVANSQVYSGLTAAAANAAGGVVDLTLNAPTALYNVRTLYFSLTTAQGSAATLNLRVYCRPHYG